MGCNRNLQEETRKASESQRPTGNVCPRACLGFLFCLSKTISTVLNIKINTKEMHFLNPFFFLTES